MRLKKGISLFATLIVAVTIMAQKQMNVADFGVTPETADCTPGIIRCLKTCSTGENWVLLFPAGTYHFYPDYGTDKYYFISNNDEGLKRVIFQMEKLRNITIDGQGSSFVFHGMANPFIVDECGHITFKNFSVDCRRPFHSEAIITAVNEDGVDVEIPENFPFRIQNGILVFTGEKDNNGFKSSISRYDNYPYDNILEFDTQKRETAYKVYDHYLNKTPVPAKSLGDRKVRIYHHNLRGTAGNTLVFAPGNREYPAFVLNNSSDICFENITVFHAGGMGIIGQGTHNVTVESCKVTPSEGRIISCTADATHFVNCTGKIILSNCLFENQMDDATNIHGIYMQIAKQLSPNEIIVQLKHVQQLGVDFLRKGAFIEYVKGSSMITKGTAKMLEVNRINKDFTYLKLDKPAPGGIVAGDAVAEIRNYPEIHIKGNIIRRNRARGMLLNCRGKTVVENNYFHSPGSALLFEGDAQYWFEQGGVSDCTIRNNVFDNCMFGTWGKAVIDFQPGITEDMETSRYNKNIRIYGNTFKVFDNSLLLQTFCVDGLIWENNRIEKTDAYPVFKTEGDYFQIRNADGVEIR